jgi:hypothetical protein
MPAGIGVDDALQRDPDSQQPMPRGVGRLEHGIDLRHHEMTQRGRIERTCREFESRLRQGGAAEIRDQCLDHVHAQRDRDDAAELRVQGQQDCWPAAAAAGQPVRVLVVTIVGP